MQLCYIHKKMVPDSINEIENIELAFLSLDDYQELKEVMIQSYSTMPNSYWKEHHIKTLIDQFPEGQIVIKVNPVQIIFVKPSILMKSVTMMLIMMVTV